jgi:carboxypeptidase C (cathepsin A)
VEWSRHEEFVKEELREWVVDGKKAGLVRSKGGLTFVTVDAAGHMVCLFLFACRVALIVGKQVPYDKPKEALALVQRWLEKEMI